MSMKNDINSALADRLNDDPIDITWWNVFRLKVALAWRLFWTGIKLRIRHWLAIDTDLSDTRNLIYGAVGQEQKQRIENSTTIVNMVKRIADQNNKMALDLMSVRDRLAFYEKHVLPIENAHRRYKKEQAAKIVEASRKASAERLLAEKKEGKPDISPVTGNGEAEPPVSKSQVRLMAEQNPQYAPYCLMDAKCVDENVRMDVVAPYVWKCPKCGADYDERLPNDQKAQKDNVPQVQ